MNSDVIKGQWSMLKGKVRTQWGKLTDNEIEECAGKKDVLIGRIQKAYGISRDEAAKQVSEFESKL